MGRYLLSLHSVEGEAGPEMTDQEMQDYFAQIHALNEEIRSSGAWVFAGALTGPDEATVVHPPSGEVLITDGPFAESKEHIAGFYVIDAEDVDAALGWATKASAAVGKPIEVRAFRDEASG